CPSLYTLSLHDALPIFVTYASSLGLPVVIKPTDGSFGRGVVSNITSTGELTCSLEYVRTELNEPDVIVEQYIPGDDVRLYVVGRSEEHTSELQSRFDLV